MSEQESNDQFFSPIQSNEQSIIQLAKIVLTSLPNGDIYIDWSDLPKHKSTRKYIIHYKSLNDSRGQSIKVSSKKKTFVLHKIRLGHLYEIHVCAIDRSKRILASTERSCIQTLALNEAPILSVFQSTPDFIWLTWEKSEQVDLSNIEAYKVVINGRTTALLPPTETKFIFNDGELCKSYKFQIEMELAGGSTISSIPINVKWPGVTPPVVSQYANGCDEIIICWTDSNSVNDGNIDNYMIHLYNAESDLTTQIGPIPAEKRQLSLQDMKKGIYYYVLETKLANSTRSIKSRMKNFECGSESQTPILKSEIVDQCNRKALFDMAYSLINIRDNIKKNDLRDECESHLEKLLQSLMKSSDFVNLKLSVEAKSNQSFPKTYQLIIDGEKTNITISNSQKCFPLELCRRREPYKLTLLSVSSVNERHSNTVNIDASGWLTFFCAHFQQDQNMTSCSYLDTLQYEKQLSKPINQGILQSPKAMPNVSVYDIIEGKTASFPPVGKARRFTIILFYLYSCLPSKKHLEQFQSYAQAHPEQYKYISINCDTNIEEIKNIATNTNLIKYYSDFEIEQYEDRKPIHRSLALEGVPTYFVLDYTYKIRWKGRIFFQEESDYESSVDHITCKMQEIQCPSHCELCEYDAMHTTAIKNRLNTIKDHVRDLEVALASHSRPTITQKRNNNRKLHVVSMAKTN